jgi:hypothetical protein
LIAKRGAGRPTNLEILKGCDPAALYNENKLSGGKRLLLIFLFASDEELRLIMMHPEFLASDTTFGTNKQKKELFTVAGLDGNNRGFNGARAFIPSAAHWVFYYLFRFCLPIFWGTDVTQRVRLNMTDGASQEYLAFINSSVRRNFISHDAKSLLLNTLHYALFL